MKALADGDTQLHDELIVKAAERLADCDVLMRASSRWRAPKPVARALSKPVLSVPTVRFAHCGESRRPGDDLLPILFRLKECNEVHRPAL
jgi:hypothetical protein